VAFFQMFKQEPSCHMSILTIRQPLFVYASDAI
jgi:hypothetical protein